MLNIRPVSDLRNKYPEIEETVLTVGEPVILTKNGYGSMVVMSLEMYSELTDETEKKLKEADIYARTNPTRLTGEEVFERARRRIKEYEDL